MPAQAHQAPAVAALQWEYDTFHAPADAQRADAPAGRLAVTRHRRPPDQAKPFEGRFAGALVDFWPTMAEAKAGMATWYAQHHGAAT